MAGLKDSSHQRLNVETTLAQVKRLRSDRAYRDNRQLFYVEGVRNFVKAVDNQFSLDTIVFSEKLLTAPLARKLVRQCRRSGVPTLSITPEQFRQISETERASGVGAIARQRWHKLDEISLDADLCWIVLETVRSPGNFGTLIRTSEAVGGGGFISIGNKIDPFDPDVVRASMGSIFHQKFVRTSLSALDGWRQRWGYAAVGASPDGTVDFHKFTYPRSALLCLGEERQGLSEKQRALCQHLVRIPMTGAVDSLNLAVAGSLLIYEVYRARIEALGAGIV